MTTSSVLDVVVPEYIWVAERPVWFGGVRLRSRTTIVRLHGDTLWVHSPGPPTDELCAALDELGEVRWIVVPNRFHHLGVPATSARYPSAIVVGPPSAESRNRDLNIAVAAHHPDYLGATDELLPLELGGVPFLDETLFFHTPTRSLIAADLLISACARDHFTWRMAALLWGRYEKSGTPPDVRWNTKASDEAAESLEKLCALPLERILVAHADAITDRPGKQLEDAWKFALPPRD